MDGLPAAPPTVLCRLHLIPLPSRSASTTTITPINVSPRTGKDCNKFDIVKPAIKGYMPVVADANAYIVCDVIDKMETETHTVFLGKVVDADVMNEDTPMTYAYYHNVIKGKSPKNAPTYKAEE